MSQSGGAETGDSPEQDKTGLWAELQALALTPTAHTMPLGGPTLSPWTRDQPRCVQTGKLSFHTRKLALTRLHELRTRGVGLTQVYRCPSCNKWHLTSQEP